jgi:geranylgeranyl pyrophosphate synthase
MVTKLSTATSRTTDLVLAPADWLAPICVEMQRVEAILEGFLPLGVPIAVDAFQHAVDAGGKRLRPAVCLLAAGAVRPGQEALPEATIKAAAVVEAMHLASLMHDDVIDEADMRRGRESTRVRWGNRASVLVGDYIAAQAYRVLIDEIGRWSTAVMCEAIMEMCEGQFAHATSKGKCTEAEYLDIIRAKTGSLFRAACEMGARTVCDEAGLVTAATSCGLQLGTAFQIVDDLLDLYADPAETGKPVGSDLRTGQHTLPVIAALERDRSGALRTVIEASAGDDLTDDAISQVAELADDLGGRAYAVRRAHEFVSAADDALSALPTSPHRDALAAICAHVLLRIP